MLVFGNMNKGIVAKKNLCNVYLLWKQQKEAPFLLYSCYDWELRSQKNEKGKHLLKSNNKYEVGDTLMLPWS